MVTATRKRVLEEDIEDSNVEGNGNVSGYEQSREKRIKENMERLQKLGIFKLSQKLKPPKMAQKNPSFRKKISTDPAMGLEPARRSSRLKTVAPVSYSEKRDTSKSGVRTLKNVEICIPEGSQPEVYTEEHVKLLGDCKSDWTLYVDGYDENRKRIYENGKSCHQCRQKTQGLHTFCSKCTSGQGQLCGDCLFMRYGENVLEVKENLNWICPFCRGICNCSRCRRVKGWMPTGALYQKVLSVGFKSVAHYLIQNGISQTNSKDLDAEKPVSSKNESEETDEDESEER